jgi:hypothetical protein
MDFLTTVFLYLVVTLALTKNLGLLLNWKLGLKVPLLTLEPSCRLQTILLNDLVGCDSPLRIVMAIWRPFLKFEACQTAIIVCRGLPCLTQEVQTQKKCAKLPLLSA